MCFWYKCESEEILLATTFISALVHFLWDIFGAMQRDLIMVKMPFNQFDTTQKAICLQQGFLLNV